MLSSLFKSKSKENDIIKNVDSLFGAKV